MQTQLLCTMIKTRRIACITIRIHHEYINVCFGPFLAQIRGNLRLIEESNIRVRYSSCYQRDVLLICYLGWIHSLNFACTTVPSKVSNVPLYPRSQRRSSKMVLGTAGWVVSSGRQAKRRSTDQEFKILPKAEVALLLMLFSKAYADIARST